MGCITLDLAGAWKGAKKLEMSKIPLHRKLRAKELPAHLSRCLCLFIQMFFQNHSHHSTPGKTNSRTLKNAGGWFRCFSFQHMVKCVDVQPLVFGSVTELNLDVPGS